MSENKPKIYASAVGRRKRAVASVRLISGSGKIIINGKPSLEYFGNDPAAHTRLELPFTSVSVSKYDAVVSAHGGGKGGQLDAAVLGISRCLVSLKSDHKTELRNNGLLTRDPRKRQRRMIGMGGKSRRKKQSPKR